MTSPSEGERFDRLMSGLDAPMTIVTTAAGGERAGCLVGFQSQCSIEPHKYALWLSKANHTYRVALRADLLAVHLIGSGDEDLAELFGGSTGDDVDKFEDVEVVRGPGGVPLLSRCPDRLVVRRTALFDEGGDHVCIVTEPVEVHGGDQPRRPLRLSEVDYITPGHQAEERPHPAAERHA